MDPLVGAARLAIGRADGLARFRATVHAFLTSLAPLLAFPLASAMIAAFRQGMLPAIELVLLTLVVQLAPPVLSHAVSVRWGKEAQWLRYATAYNWCYWAIPILAAVVLLFLLQSGLAAEATTQLFVLILGCYGLWLNWFLAKHGLDVSGWRAAGFVVMVNGGTMALVLLPALLGQWLDGPG